MHLIIVVVINLQRLACLQRVQFTHQALLIHYYAKNFRIALQVLSVTAFCLRVYYYYCYYYVRRVGLLLSRHSSVSILTGRAGRLRNHGSIPHRGKRFSPLQTSILALGLTAIQCVPGVNRG